MTAADIAARHYRGMLGRHIPPGGNRGVGRHVRRYSPVFRRWRVHSVLDLAVRDAITRKPSPPNRTAFFETARSIAGGGYAPPCGGEVPCSARSPSLGARPAACPQPAPGSRACLQLASHRALLAAYTQPVSHHGALTAEIASRRTRSYRHIAAHSHLASYQNVTAAGITSLRILTTDITTHLTRSVLTAGITPQRVLTANITSQRSISPETCSSSAPRTA